MIAYLTNQLQENDETYQERESEIVSLKRKLERSDASNRKQFEEISMLKSHLEDAQLKEKELTNKIQEKGSEIDILLERLNKEMIISLKFGKST